MRNLPIKSVLLFGATALLYSSPAWAGRQPGVAKRNVLSGGYFVKLEFAGKDSRGKHQKIVINQSNDEFTLDHKAGRTILKVNEKSYRLTNAHVTAFESNEPTYRGSFDNVLKRAGSVPKALDFLAEKAGRTDIREIKVPTYTRRYFFTGVGQDNNHDDSITFQAQRGRGQKSYVIVSPGTKFSFKLVGDTAHINAHGENYQLKNPVVSYQRSATGLLNRVKLSSLGVAANAPQKLLREIAERTNEAARKEGMLAAPLSVTNVVSR